MTPQAILPAVLVPLIGYRLYRRFRTSFGQQPVQTGRMIWRMSVLGIVGAVMLFFAAHDVAALAAAFGGLALGAAVGFAGLRLTRFERTPSGTVYTPNPYIGAALSALLVGRLVYRFFILNPTLQTTMVHASAHADRLANPWASSVTNPWAAYQSSPLTLAMFTLIVGYYLTYFTGILLTARKTGPAQ